MNQGVEIEGGEHAEVGTFHDEQEFQGGEVAQPGTFQDQDQDLERG